MNQKKNNKKGKPWIGLVIFLIMLLPSMGDIFYQIRRALWRSGIDDEVFMPILIIVVIAVILAAVEKAKKKSGNAGRSFVPDAVNRYGEHSHDRLTVNRSAIRSCDGLEHWKDQLDGFMKAGLIDRSEYNVLLERYRREIDSNKGR